MAFENLLKPPHRNRFLLALAAAVVALVVYLGAEHFRVVPSSASLDEEARTNALGERSMLIVPESRNEIGALSYGAALELIRELVRVPDIEVIGARSSLAYPDLQDTSQPPPHLPDTAWTVEIRAVPEGEGYRLGATLLAASGGVPEWGMEQLRPAGEIPAFIREVAAALAGRLGFAAQDGASGMQSVDPAYYRDYQTALLMLTLGNTSGAQAGRLLEEVLQAAPDSASALAAHAYSLALQTAAGAEDGPQLLATARAELQRALTLQPGLAEAHLYGSLIAHRFDWDWQQAYNEAQAALAEAPGDAAVLAAASTAAFTLGRFVEGEDQLRRAIVLDPLVPSHRLKYGLMLEFNGQHQAAIDAYRALMVLDPDYPGAHAYLARTLMIVGRTQIALKHAEIEPDPFWSLYAQVLALDALGRGNEANEKLEILVRDHGSEAAAQIAEIHANAGRVDDAFEWLERAVDQRDPGVASLIGNPLLASLHEDPRWAELLQKLGLPVD